MHICEQITRNHLELTFEPLGLSQDANLILSESLQPGVQMGTPRVSFGIRLVIASS